jgi:hypothetical protein
MKSEPLNIISLSTSGNHHRHICRVNHLTSSLIALPVITIAARLTSEKLAGQGWQKQIFCISHFYIKISCDCTEISGNTNSLLSSHSPVLIFVWSNTFTESSYEPQKHRSLCSTLLLLLSLPCSVLQSGHRLHPFPRNFCTAVTLYSHPAAWQILLKTAFAIFNVLLGYEGKILFVCLTKQFWNRRNL